jgi:hypothetical protein
MLMLQILNIQRWCCWTFTAGKLIHVMLNEALIALHRELWLYFDHVEANDTLTVALYCKYWIYNRTEFNMHFYGQTTLIGGQGNFLDCSISLLKLVGEDDQLEVRDLNKYSAREWYSYDKTQSVEPFLYSPGPHSSTHARIRIDSSQSSEVPVLMNVGTHFD